VEGGAAPPQQKAPPATAAASSGPRPELTIPQQLAFGAFVLYAALALFADISAAEVEDMGKLTMFLIAALLPSDALIRYGRNLLFQTVDDPDKAATYAPATTLAQMLAFATYVIVLVLTLFSGVSAQEFANVSEAARVLIVALLPSDAGIRFGRAMYFRSDRTPTPSRAQLKKV
jgi:hypothetical protein